MALKRNGLEGLEIVEFMPKAFVLLYHSTVEDALASQMSVQRTADATGAAMPKRRFHTPDGGLKDEEALALKQRIDHELRRLTRRISSGEVDEPRIDARNRDGHCPMCGRTKGAKYNFCPECGAVLSEKGAQRFGEVMAKTIADKVAASKAEILREASEEVRREVTSEETISRVPRLM